MPKPKKKPTKGYAERVAAGSLLAEKIQRNTPDGYPTWVEMRAFLMAELEARNQPLLSLVQIDESLNYGTVRDAMKVSGDAKWSTIMRIICAMGFTPEGVLRKLKKSRG